ncbi:MAG: hypothetical protein ACOXZ6_12700 [Syntrophomonadaceae bacterium]
MLDVTPNFPREYKFTIGSKMHEISVSLISEITAAYINRDRETRIQHLINFQSEFEVFENADAHSFQGKKRINNKEIS